MGGTTDGGNGLTDEAVGVIGIGVGSNAIEVRARHLRHLQGQLEGLALWPQVSFLGARRMNYRRILLGRLLLRVIEAAKGGLFGLLGLARLRADLLQDLFRVGPPHPTGKTAGVLALQRLIADLRHHGDRATQGLQAAFGTVDAITRDDGLDDELEHGDSIRHQITHGSIAFFQAQVAGVHAIRGHGDKGLAGEFLLAIKSAHGGFLPRLIAVEGIDELAAEIRIIEHESAQHLKVLTAKGGAARCDCGFHPSGIHGHDVRVALYHHCLVVIGNIALGQVEAEEHLGLAIEHGLGGVHVLAELVVVEKLAGAKANHVAG